MFKGYIIEQLIRERKVKKADVYRYADSKLPKLAY